MNGSELPDSGQETLRVSSLHALAYCPRLFYLEEVEELYTQDDAVFAGRRLHVEIEKEEGDVYESLMLESEALGLRGKVDALRMRSGQTIPYEHKRGRCRRDEQNQPQAWDSDRLQILAYACLIEAALGVTVAEGRIRYHADNVLVKVPLDEQGRQQVRQAIEQARQLRRSTERPPVTSNERLCVRCALAPVCLPEETRFAQAEVTEPIRLFPEDDDREIVHVLEPGACVGRSATRLRSAARMSQLSPYRRIRSVRLCCTATRRFQLKRCIFVPNSRLGCILFLVVGAISAVSILDRAVFSGGFASIEP